MKAFEELQKEKMIVEFDEKQGDFQCFIVVVILVPSAQGTVLRLLLG